MSTSPATFPQSVFRSPVDKALPLGIAQLLWML